MMCDLGGKAREGCGRGDTYRERKEIVEMTC
jgi:hypothetical protein